MEGPAFASEPPAYQYDVTAGPDARTLEIDARLAPGSGRVLVVDPGLHEFIQDARVEQADGWRSLTRSGAALLAPECEQAGCRIRYSFDLERAAREVGDLYRALEHHGALLAPPSGWLLRPLRERQGRYRLSVATPVGVRFVSGVSPSADAGDAYEGTIESIDRAAYSGFGPFKDVRLEVGGGVVELAIAPGERRLSDDALERWVADAAGAVSGFFGRLPVRRVLVLALPGGRRPVGFGTMRAGGGASVMIFVGREASHEDLARDWVLAHELTHLGFPDVSDAPTWIEEGLATYLEPLARAQAGLTAEEAVWGEMMEGLPRGLEGEGGLDSASGYGRIYWGGALYWMLCDLELRERTANARGLRDVLRAILADGGDASVSWSLERTLDALERAAGHPVFHQRLKRMASEPAREDLAELWRRLGVLRRAEGVAFDDQAPLAAIRRSLSAASASSSGAR
jgi:hypothetical protein